jgi:putative tricarboxylic transport membrane protein
MKHDDMKTNEPALVSNLTMEILVALLFLAGSALVIFDSARLGFGWEEGVGPASGYFPFYIAVFMGIASLITLVQALLGRTEDAGETFVSRRAFGRVLAVLIPTIVFIGLIGYLGLYVASAIFIAAFMLFFGRQNPLKAMAVGVGVPFALFMLFEKWFLVPLPKGPLETMLGY